jgi:hypothetical protein
MSLKRVASGSNMQAAGAAAPALGAAAGPGAAAAAAAGNLAKRGRLASNSLGGGAGMPAAAIAAAAGAAAGSMIPGVDYDALEQLTSTQAAKQLGTSGEHVLVDNASAVQPVPAVPFACPLAAVGEQLGTHATTLRVACHNCMRVHLLCASRAETVSCQLLHQPMSLTLATTTCTGYAHPVLNAANVTCTRV